jgi:hypothetical protein
MENLSEACDWKFVVSSHFEFSTLYSLEGRDMIVGLMPQPFVFLWDNHVVIVGEVGRAAWTRFQPCGWADTQTRLLKLSRFFAFQLKVNWPTAYHQHQLQVSCFSINHRSQLAFLCGFC